MTLRSLILIQLFWVFAAQAQGPKLVLSFDHDDTIIRMPTKIILFSKSKPGEKKEITTSRFAEIREQLGKPGEWVDYEVKTNPNSFEYSRTRPQKYFVKDIAKALASPERTWKTKQTDLFMQQLESKNSAEMVTVITARGHERSEILEGYKLLINYYSKKTGKKYYLPLEKNIFVVGGAADTSLEKANVMIKLLDSYQKIGVKEWIFFDDDAGNVRKMNEVLKKEKNRWPGMKIKIEHVPYSQEKSAAA